jgi:hypothetical protein
VTGSASTTAQSGTGSLAAGTSTPSASGGGFALSAPATSSASSTPGTTPTISDIKNGPLAKAGQNLITIYEEFEQQGGSPTFSSSESGRVLIKGANVGVDITSNGGAFDVFVSNLEHLGMQVTASSATSGTVEGLLPISQLPTVAQNPQTLSLSPIYIARAL